MILCRACALLWEMCGEDMLMFEAAQQTYFRQDGYITELNQASQVNQTNQTNQTNQVSAFNQTNQVNQVSAFNQVNTNQCIEPIKSIS